MSLTAQPGIFVHGIGAVSPAGWGIAPLREALDRGEPISTKELNGPSKKPFHVRQVPPSPSRPAFLSHARLRRSSPISQYAVAAALEALGADVQQLSNGSSRLGIIFCAFSGCINYSRRFYDETLRDPATASPLVFPETVFNAPASHLAALLGTMARNYTLVGDHGTFLQGLALGADWLSSADVDGCLVIGAEEMDWMTADTQALFARNVIPGEGAGAVYLRREPGGTRAELRAVTDSHLFTQIQSRAQAAKAMRAQLPTAVEGHLLCDGVQGVARYDTPEVEAWSNWRCARLSPKIILGEALVAAAAWQCVAALDALCQSRYAAANVSVVGCNQQAIGARFARAEG